MPWDLKAVRFKVTLPKDLKAQLATHAKARDVSESHIIREALANYLAERGHTIRDKYADSETHPGRNLHIQIDRMQVALEALRVAAKSEEPDPQRKAGALTNGAGHDSNEVKD